MLDLDLFVVGTGPAGQRAAVQAAKIGKKVAICDRADLVGGVCMNTGTIPSKTFREAVLFLTGLRHRGIYGSAFTVKEAITMKDLLLHCDHVIRKQTEVIRDQMRRNGIQLLSGEASFVTPHQLDVTGPHGATRVQAKTVVLATGTVPSVPKDVAVDGETVITSDGVLGLKELPRSLTVVGGGVIGTEYASMFGAVGVKVTLIDKRHRLLEFVDAEIAEALSYQMRGMNTTLRLHEEVASVQIEGPHRAVANLKSGKKVVSEVLLYSIGRAGATAGLALANAGLSADARGRLDVNEHYQTAVPHIYAVGDLIGFPSLASTAAEQGRLASCHAFGLPHASLPELFPYGIYSIPEISMVGKHEEELTEQGVPYETGIARFREIARGAILGDDSGLLKLLFHRETREVLGVHVIGTGATELVHIGQAVIALKGTLDYLLNSVFNYPTFAECYKVAALDGYNKVRPFSAEPSHARGLPV